MSYARRARSVRLSSVECVVGSAEEMVEELRHSALEPMTGVESECPKFRIGDSVQLRFSKARLQGRVLHTERSPFCPDELIYQLQIRGDTALTWRSDLGLEPTTTTLIVQSFREEKRQ